MPVRAAGVPAWAASNTRALHATFASLVLVAGCGSNPEPVAEAPPYLDPGFVESAEHRLHYALTPSRDLPAAIAGSYGIEQRKDLAVLVIALSPRDAHAGGRVDVPQAEAAADAVSLTGARQRLALSRHDEAGSATWIAEVQVRHRVPITIEIRARATAGGPFLRARLTREFRVE